MKIKTVIRSIVYLRQCQNWILNISKQPSILYLCFCQSSSNHIQNILQIPLFRVFRIFCILEYSVYSAIPFPHPAIPPNRKMLRLILRKLFPVQWKTLPTNTWYCNGHKDSSFFCQYFHGTYWTGPAQGEGLGGQRTTPPPLFEK